jgi:hypothetical protein
MSFASKRASFENQTSPLSSTSSLSFNNEIHSKDPLMPIGPISPLYQTNNSFGSINTSALSMNHSNGSILSNRNSFNTFTKPPKAEQPLSDKRASFQQPKVEQPLSDKRASYQQPKISTINKPLSRQNTNSISSKVNGSHEKVSPLSSQISLSGVDCHLA